MTFPKSVEIGGMQFSIVVEDGTLVVETDGDPMAWLRGVPDGVVDSAEIGVPRLDDLYDALFATKGRGGKP
jgi:hypothetical protein